MTSQRSGRRPLAYAISLIAAPLGLAAAACTAILGSFDVAPAGAGDASSDAPATDGPPTGDTGTDAPAPAVLTGIVAVASGARHSCALTSDDHVVCWGDNSAGQLGTPVASLPRTAIPVAVAGLPPVKQIAAGLFHTCAVERANPRVWCWGKNECGELGRGTIDTAPIPTPAKIGVPDAGLEVDAVEVSCGDTHACAVESGGSVYCWGCNNFAQLAQPNIVTVSSLPVVAVPGSSRAQTASSGAKHSCAVLAAINGVACWGAEDFGALGDGPPVASQSAVPVNAADAGANGAAHITAGQDHTCMIDADQKLFCWGASDLGQAGVTSPGGVAEPHQVETANRALQASAGGTFTCYVTPAKAVLCFGANDTGQLGRGTTDTQPHPTGAAVQALGQPGATLEADSISAGRDHACAVSAQGVVCWGGNSDGQIGDGTTGTARPAPVAVVAPAK